MSYLVGIDIGGTFTDCAIVDRGGRLLTTKVPSTPADFSRGMMDALGAGAQVLGLSLDDFCRDIAFLSHGTTVGTNTIIQKKGARVGLITTKGHEDAIHIMRGSRGYGGRDIRKVVHFPETSKPAPIVDRKSTRLNSSHLVISYAVFCLKKKKKQHSPLTKPNTVRYDSLRPRGCRSE